MSEINSLSFTLFDMERAIAQRDYASYEQFITTLFTFLDFRYPLESVLKQGDDGDVICTHKGLQPFTDQLSIYEKEMLYSRLASTITTYLSDTQYTPSNEVLVHFVLYKTILSNIFYLSCYGNMDHILFNQGLMNEGFTLNLKTEQDIKLLYACITLNTQITFDPVQLAQAIPKWGEYWYLGLMYGQHHAFNARIEANFNTLFDAQHIIRDMALDGTSVELATSTWMLCSYLDRPDRHEIKKSVNHAIQKWISKTAFPPGSLKRLNSHIENTGEVKKIIVLSEQYKSNHAMYRCYHPEMVKLKEKYHMTLIAPSATCDDKSKQDFHDYIDIADKAESLVDAVTKISKIEPDLIFFPSLGMAKWTIPLANMRLAKYQIMCYGHPASAFSQYIDYSYCSKPKYDWDFQQFCLEKIVPVYQGEDFVWEPYPGYEPKDYAKPNDGVVRIAINSSLPKITSRFIKLCQLILQHSSVPVEFNFFLISRDDAFEKSALERLGAASRVFRPTDYETYMENLSRCDLAIGTFPFGGSNTNTDVSMLGIPKIFYSEECGLASYSDQTALEKLDLPDILKPKSEAELLTNLIYLVHDKTMRDEISQNIKDKKPFDIFYKHKSNPDATSSCKMVDVIHWIEEHHEGLQKERAANQNELGKPPLPNEVSITEHLTETSSPDLGDQLSKMILEKTKRTEH